MTESDASTELSVAAIGAPEVNAETSVPAVGTPETEVKGTLLDVGKLEAKVASPEPPSNSSEVDVMISVAKGSDITVRSGDVTFLPPEVNVTFSVLLTLGGGDEEVITAVLSRKAVVTLSPVTPSSGVNEISPTAGVTEVKLVRTSVLRVWGEKSPDELCSFVGTADSPLTDDDTNESVSPGVTSSSSPETVTDEDSYASSVVSPSLETVAITNSYSPDVVILSPETVAKGTVSRSLTSLDKTVTSVAASVVPVWCGPVRGETTSAVPRDRGGPPVIISELPVDFVTSSPLPEGPKVSDESVLTVTTLEKSDKSPDPVLSSKYEVIGTPVATVLSDKSPEENESV